MNLKSLPGRGWLIGVCIVLIIIGIAIKSIDGGRGNSYRTTELQPQITRNPDGSVIVTMTGREEQGIATGIILQPKESAVVSYLGGKIICNTRNGFTAPIWGVPIEKTHPSWIPLMPYAKKGIWTDAVCVLLGDQVCPFKQEEYKVVVKNDTLRPYEIRLFFHDAWGYFGDNKGDAKFLVIKT